MRNGKFLLKAYRNQDLNKTNLKNITHCIITKLAPINKVAWTNSCAGCSLTYLRIQFPLVQRNFIIDRPVLDLLLSARI